MNADVFAEWMCLRGYRVLRTASSYWVEAGPRVYQAFPYHRLVQADEEEVNTFLRQNNAVALRYSTTMASGQGMVSYHVLREKGSYSLSDLRKKARYDVRQGLQRASIEPIPFPRLAAEGWAQRMDGMHRQARVGAEDPAWWQRLCKWAATLPGFEAWGAVVSGELAASLVAFTCDDCCSILYHQSRTAYLSTGMNNALAFVFTSEALQRLGTSRVFYGLHSLDAPPSVDEFKFRMGYMAKPVRQRVVFHPWLRPLINRASHGLLRRLLHWRSGDAALAKAEGMVRFYLEGQRALPEQDWPPALVGRRDELLAM